MAASSDTLLESTATLEMQARRAGLSEAWIESFRRNNLNKLGAFAYVLTTPGVAPSTEQVAQLLEQVRKGVTQTISEIAAIKRLVFEAQTFIMANLQSEFATMQLLS